MVYKVKAVGITTEQTPCALQSYQALQIVCARLAGQANDSIQLQPRAIFKISFFFPSFLYLFAPFPIHRPTATLTFILQCPTPTLPLHCGTCMAVESPKEGLIEQDDRSYGTHYLDTVRE